MLTTAYASIKLKFKKIYLTKLMECDTWCYLTETNIIILHLIRESQICVLLLICPFNFFNLSMMKDHVIYFGWNIVILFPNNKFVFWMPLTFMNTYI